MENHSKSYKIMKKQEHTTSSNQNIMQMKAEAEEEEEKIPAR